MKKPFCSLGFLFVLVACGGGGDDGTPALAPVARTFVYETETPATSVASFLDQLNKQGARGYRYFADVQVTAGGPSGSDAFYAKSEATTYRYELSGAATTVAAFEAQLVAQAARGFRWEFSHSVGGVTVELYSQREKPATNWSYRVVAPPELNAAAIAAQANLLGTEGYRYVSAVGRGIRGWVYEKDLNSSARYEFVALDLRVTNNEMVMQQLRDQTASGYRFHSAIFPTLEVDRNINIYVRDATQSSRFSYTDVEGTASSAALLARLNSEGANGRAPSGPPWYPGFNPRRYYVKADNCTGVLCETPGPFGF